MKNQSITQIAYKILKKKGKPLHYKEITKLIMKEREVKGKSPGKTITCCLYRDQKFEKIGKKRNGIYGLTEWK